MAFAIGTPLAITRPSGRNDFYVDYRRRVKIIPFTKLTGDTSGSAATGLTYVKAITVLKADMSVDTTATCTTGASATGGALFTSTLTNLSTGYTAGYLIVEGGKN